MTKGDHVHDPATNVLATIRDHLAQRGIDPESVTEDAGLFDDLGLDSLDTMDLTLALEERFGIQIPDEDLEGLRTVGDAVALIDERLSART